MHAKIEADITTSNIKNYISDDDLEEFSNLNLRSTAKNFLIIIAAHFDNSNQSAGQGL